MLKQKYHDHRHPNFRCVLKINQIKKTILRTNHYLSHRFYKHQKETYTKKKGTKTKTESQSKIQIQ